ncbi:MAG: sugar phosphate isomerase/epimerase [Clostridia bacterium]|nr:sugar phosphate isomerase/epimerase [Clostridia bacterium]
MRIGTMSILFREQNGTSEHIGYVESLQRIRRAGFEVADLNLCQLCAHKTTLHQDNWQEETEKIAEAVKTLCISLPQCHLPFKSKKVRWESPEDYAYYIKMFYRAIDVAVMLGIPWAVVHPERSADHPGFTRAQHLAANHKEYDALVDYALGKGLKIAFENMRMGYGSDAEDLVELIDSFHDIRIGACWDTGHANTHYKKGDQWDALHIIGNRLHCTHIDDNRGDEDLHLLPWEGMVDWARVIAALRDINYSGDLILEGFINLFAPDSLKDENGRHAFAVMSQLLTL